MTLNLRNNRSANCIAVETVVKIRNDRVIFSSSPSLSSIHLFYTQTLATLDISNNQFGDDGARIIAGALKYNRVILFLSFNLSHIHPCTVQIDTYYTEHLQ
jgi:Ran GTPase-activating protein (RanGAP) involved in mRNA processing and transport